VLTIPKGAESLDGMEDERYKQSSSIMRVLPTRLLKSHVVRTGGNRARIAEIEVDSPEAQD